MVIRDQQHPDRNIMAEAVFTGKQVEEFPDQQVTV
jgi:hypothetical protein